MSEMFLPHIVGEERASLVARFWSQIATGDPAQCWRWLGGCATRDGGKPSYGRFTVRGEHIYAHRFAYQIVHGALPDELIVRHKCDNEPCTNPQHLIKGTIEQNTRDKFERGRGADRRGEKHPLARLTASDVLRIRQLRSIGTKQEEVAAFYGISRAQVYRITSGKNWGHIA